MTNTQAQTQQQLPKYRCHKDVWALKIAGIQQNETASDGFQTAIITPVEPGYAPFTVDRDFITKHQPKVGGYYVVYKDGYKSFSPAEAFEDGYTLIK